MPALAYCRNPRTMSMGLLAGILAAAGFTAPAQATWSILLVNTKTGEIAIGSATCLTGFDLQANTPVLITGIGGATAQSFVDQGGFNRVFIRDRLLMGQSPVDILSGLAVFDGSGHQTRQYGIIDTRSGGRAATFSGTGAGAWAGGLTGRGTAIGHAGTDVVYAIQGNVLTGAPVVQMAEAAVLATPGDLAAKLMASMEAARAMGGDGRCSCSGGNPTGCGVPPPTFTKSAHIAYMLIARTGDRDGCNGLYRAQTAPFVSRAADLNGDGRPEVVCINTSTSSVSVYSNISTGDGQGALGRAVHYPGLMSPRDLVLTDVTGDGALDIVVASLAGDRASIFTGNGDGTFGGLTHLPAGDGPFGVATGDFNGDGVIDIAVANSSDDSLSVMLGMGGGVFAPAITIATMDNPGTVAVADIDGDGDVDIVLGSSGSAGVQIVRNSTPDGGLLALVAEPAIVAGGAGIAQTRIADVDADGDLDIVSAAGANNAIVLLINDGAGGFDAQSIAFGPVPGGVEIADVTGDGVVDLVGVSRVGASSRLGVFRGLGGGMFETPAVLSALSSTPGRLELCDIDQDGDLDALVPMQSLGAMQVINNLGGMYNDGVGCATGDYFMEFNIANQSAAAPDPVLQLQARYDAWRTGLIGKPDAEQSGVTLSRPVVAADDNACVQTLTIRLRDWQGTDVAASAQTLSVFHGPGSASRAAISDPVIAPDGAATVTITSPFPMPDQLGADSLAVRIEPVGAVSETNRAVTLMPLSRLARVPHADINLDGEVNVPDIFAFLSIWFAAAQGADYDGSGVVDPADVFAFLDRWFLAV